MKKSIAAILLVLYVAFSSGIVISYHYCMDSFNSFQFGASDNHICGKCGMDITNSNGCCNDEVKIFKIQDDQQVTTHDFKFDSPVAIMAQFSPVNNELLIISYNKVSFNDHSPPLSKQDTYLQNCVFRI